jgi:hypothetical protein
MSIKEITFSCLEKIIIVGGILLGITLMITGNIAIFAIFALLLSIAVKVFEFVLDLMNVSIPTISLDDKYEPYFLGAVCFYIFVNMILGFIKGLKKDKNNN